MLMLVGTGLHTALAMAGTSEQALTVAFLYNFLKFAEWPEDPSQSELTLCVIESADFGNELEKIAGRSVQNKKVRIKQLGLNENPGGCQLLFIPGEEKPVRIREWLKNTANTPILVVSNMNEFLDMGGMILLVENDQRLQFEVNLEPVRRAGLRLNSQLLQIARSVRGN